MNDASYLVGRTGTGVPTVGKASVFPGRYLLGRTLRNLVDNITYNTAPTTIFRGRSEVALELRGEARNKVLCIGYSLGYTSTYRL